MPFGVRLKKPQSPELQEHCNYKWHAKGSKALPQSIAPSTPFCLAPAVCWIPQPQQKAAFTALLRVRVLLWAGVEASQSNLNEQKFDVPNVVVCTLWFTFAGTRKYPLCLQWLFLKYVCFQSSQYCGNVIKVLLMLFILLYCGKWQYLGTSSGTSCLLIPEFIHIAVYQHILFAFHLESYFTWQCLL